jgi:hypothetical protein
MRAESSTLAKSPNFRSGECLQQLADLGSALPLAQAIGKVCQWLWPAPAKADAELAYRVGATDRACREVVNGRSTLSTEKLAQLLRSEEGIVFLAAVMANAKPAWWVAFLEQTKIHDARRKAARLQRELRETMNAVDETAAAIARAEHAAAVSDEEFHRPHVAAMRAAAGLPDRAMAKARR